jgi:two-component system LytT family response regulator
MIKTIIVEDEKKSREMLLKLIAKNCPQLQVVADAASVKDAVAAIREHKPDLVFLDIELADGTGFDVLEKIGDANFDIIFATAYDQYAIKAIKYSAIDYLLKPYEVDELKNAAARIAEKRSKSSGFDNLHQLIENLKKKDNDYSKITLPTGSAYEIVNINDIIRCKAEASYTYFYLTGKREYLVTLSLGHYEEILPTQQFMRIHHAHLININHVARMLKEDSGYAIMTDGSKIEVSRRKKDQFLDALNKLTS